MQPPILEKRVRGVSITQRRQSSESCWLSKWCWGGIRASYMGAWEASHRPVCSVLCGVAWAFHTWTNQQPNLRAIETCHSSLVARNIRCEARATDSKRRKTSKCDSWSFLQAQLWENPCTTKVSQACLRLGLYSTGRGQGKRVWERWADKPAEGASSKTAERAFHPKRETSLVRVNEQAQRKGSHYFAEQDSDDDWVEWTISKRTPAHHIAQRSRVGDELCQSGTRAEDSLWAKQRAFWAQ